MTEWTRSRVQTLPLDWATKYNDGLCQVALEVRKETLKAGQPLIHCLVSNSQYLIQQLESRVSCDPNIRWQGPESNDTRGNDAVVEERT